MTKKTILTLVKTVVPLLLGVYLIWVFFAGMTGDAKLLFYKAIREANYFWIVISMILGFIAFISRAYRWKYVLEPLFRETNKIFPYFTLPLSLAIFFSKITWMIESFVKTLFKFNCCLKLNNIS